MAPKIPGMARPLFTDSPITLIWLLLWIGLIAGSRKLAEYAEEQYQWRSIVCMSDNSELISASNIQLDKREHIGTKHTSGFGSLFDQLPVPERVNINKYSPSQMKTTALN